MAFENFLGGFAGPIDEMSGIQSALAQNAMRAPPPQQRRGGGLGNILGMLGDAISIGAGGQPLYQQRRRQEAVSGAMQNFMDDPRAAVQALLQAGEPEMAIQLLNATKQRDDRPGIMREFDEVSRLPPDQRGAFMEYLKTRFPGAMSPIIMGENDTLEMPGQSAPQGEMIAEDGNGNRVRYNPQSGAWEPMGGETDSAPSSPFPG